MRWRASIWQTDRLIARSSSARERDGRIRKAARQAAARIERVCMAVAHMNQSGRVAENAQSRRGSSPIV
jgi:hypothetical protein